MSDDVNKADRSDSYFLIGLNFCNPDHISRGVGFWLPSSMATSRDDDPTGVFLTHSQRILNDAQFIVDSLPNVEPFAVERAVRQLHAINLVLLNFNDPWLNEDDIAGLMEEVVRVVTPLELFREEPPPLRNLGLRVVQTGARGRPRYDLDLNRALELHNLGNTWDAIADAMGASRRTLYYHLERANISTGRRPFTEISDDELDERVSAISLAHPLAGSSIVMGHLEALGIHVSSERVQESLRRVDAIGVLARWTGVIKRRVYRVRGANSLWHHDANEKIRPWGFWIHGCIDGYSRLIIYLTCCNNKRQTTVEALFMRGVRRFGWPSRARGDYGLENNRVERYMITQWGEPHRAYLRGRLVINFSLLANVPTLFGRSVQNIRIERLWRDVRHDTIESFRQIFLHLEEIGLLNMDLITHRLCLYFVFQPHIQKSLDETTSSWNNHKVRTAGNKTPTAIYQLSKELAINRGYWSDPGDDIRSASDPSYGHDPEVPLPPTDELNEDPTHREDEEFPDPEAEREAGLFINDDSEIEAVRELLKDMDPMREDENWGIDVYCESVVRLSSYFAEDNE